jgi:DNA-directed RNA polymerase subunit RPC12/RpoP
LRTRRYCPDCLASRDHAPGDSGEFRCEKCGRAYSARFESISPGGPIERCAYCGNRAFFLEKDFDQRLGCLFLAISLAAALVVGWRFGWVWFTPVLLATVLVDWIVAVRIRPVTICYRCDAEYRDLPRNERHRGYDPHVAERYAKTKTVRRMR